MKPICQVLSFSQAKEVLKAFGFFGHEDVVEDYISEAHIFSSAHKLGREIVFKPIPDWNEFEVGKIDISPSQLIDTCFQGLELQSEELLIITMESYLSKKVFLVDYINYLEFAENYGEYLGEDMDFVQPMDYIIFLLKIGVAVYIHHDGEFTQIKLT